MLPDRELVERYLTAIAAAAVTAGAAEPRPQVVPLAGRATTPGDPIARAARRRRAIQRARARVPYDVA